MPHTEPTRIASPEQPVPIDRRQFMKVAAITTASAFAGSATTAAAQPPGQNPAAQGIGPDSNKEVPLAPPDAQPPELPIPKPVVKKMGWAVVGLGELALAQVMPAFAQCKYSAPVALVSGHPDKARTVAKAYHIEEKSIYNYDNFDRIIDDPAIDIVYIVLPNSMHAEYTIRALQAGKHVLCEKPMAPTVVECENMIAAARKADRKLMIAYRLHYEPANLAVMELCKTKALGELRTFSSSNCQDVSAPNIRLSSKLGGGPVGDVGVYSINAARYCTREEPVEVTAFAQQPAGDPRFREVPESVSFTMRFSSGVLAMCECSFGTARSEFYRVVCTRGYIEMDPAFSYQGQRVMVKEAGGKDFGPRKSQLEIKEINQFTSEFDHFSQCILNNKEPRTPGEEGLADMRIVTAIHESVKTGRPVKIGSA
ncbi:MAG: gfo/Idh/MocA family oxidoreductase [Chthoniobacteraceae bacterium]|nr:gfo/Idh/MocA family oxidoreductase [Chthoniobacteraceae bacterium]